MGQRTVARRSPSSGITALFEQFLFLGAESKTLTARANELKKDLASFAEANGEVDDKGHQVFNLAAAVEVGGQKFRGFMRQRRISQSFNEDKARILCESKGFDRQDYIETIEVISQDKIARLYAEDRLTEGEFDSLIEESETFAFVPVKGS